MNRCDYFERSGKSDIFVIRNCKKLFLLVECFDILGGLDTQILGLFILNWLLFSDDKLVIS